jgi:hypothetical protein
MLTIKQYAQKASEAENINIMINKLRQEIEEIDNEEAEGEYQNEGEIYEGEQDEGEGTQQPKGETLEEKRDKGLKEIFYSEMVSNDPYYTSKLN